MLRRASPAPREEFVRELERSLFRQRIRREPHRLRLVAAGCWFAAVLAVVVIGLSVADLLP